MIKRNVLTIVIVVLLAIIPLGVIVYYAVESNNRDQTVTGAFVLTNPESINKLGRYCTGQREFTDLQRNTPVRVWDAFGNVLASGETSTGVQGDSTCTFEFTLNDVPEVEEYHFQYGDNPVIVVPRSQLEEAGWSVSFAVGG